MAQNTVNNINKTFPIYKADGTSFYGLTIRKATVESVVMSLGDKISGDVYYPNNNLPFTMQEYVELDGVRYYLVNPPTVVREGLVKDNNGLNGMTKYSLVFYHPMYMLGNFSFTDIAVTEDEEKYLSQDKTFYWIGKLPDFIDKLNANLQATEWIVSLDISPYDEAQMQKAQKMSEVLSFDKQFISDALKTAYDTWEIPFVISQINEGEEHYDNGKRFLISFGLPTQEIYEEGSQTPFVFRFGKDVGLKNNSRTPKNNKIVTRLVGYGAERNIPFGYPQIRWYGNQDWDYTIDNDPTNPNSYPIYKGIVGGAYVKLIKHPFTRKTLMPSVYAESVFNKVSPYLERQLPNGNIVPNPNYNPDAQIIDYIDADGSYPNQINLSAPSVEIHQFEEEYPHLGESSIVNAYPIDTQSTSGKVIEVPFISAFITNTLTPAKNASNIQNEKDAIQGLIDFLQDIANQGGVIPYYDSYTDENNGGAYTFKCSVQPMVVSKPNYWLVNYTSGTFNITDQEVCIDAVAPDWDDTMDDNGEYVQSYFKIVLPQLSFDIYACASITENMQINMRSGACLGCTFNIQVDWEDYKKNFYDENGEFAPQGEQRDYAKYPDSSQGSIEVIVQKDLDTFGTLMPNKYQYPKANDQFVILGISLPLSYITNAELQLDETMGEYMLENNVYYYEYPLKFSEHFLATHLHILSQIKNNTAIRFQYSGVEMALFVKQITIKYGEQVLPQWDITLTDDVEIVLSKIGQVTDDVSRMRVQLSELQKYYSENLIDAINEKLSRVYDDVCQGRITFQQGLDVLGRVVFSDEIKSNNFRSGLYEGAGWRIDELGNAELESLRVRSYLEVVELLINRLQAQEGDTVFSDNDQIEKVEEVKHITTGGTEVSYVLSLKEKFDGYFTAQKYGNILKGIINTLAAKQAGVSDYDDSDAIESDGINKYFTSWMQVVGVMDDEYSVDTISSHEVRTLEKNQIRVTLFGDESVPARKNFLPCQLMNIVRWGCVLNPDEEGISPAEKRSRKQRQSFFAISAKDGRITKYTGVNSPILQEWNYGTTLGELPDFVKSWSGIGERLIEGRDYLYAQGVIVGDFIKVDINGAPLINYVDMGEWQPNTTYLVNEYNGYSLQWETHDVWHLGHKWRCMIHQPVGQGGTLTYYEPKWKSDYWRMIEGDSNLTMEFVSSNGYSFRQGYVDTTITPYIFYGGIDITDSINEEFFSWERTSEHPTEQSEELDRTWNAQHEGEKALHLTSGDMPLGWSNANKAIFTCKCEVNDGRTQTIVENQIIT